LATDFEGFAMWAHADSGGAVVASARCDTSGRVLRVAGVEGTPTGSELHAERVLSLTLLWERMGRP
jgi:hypothetical protein